MVLSDFLSRQHGDNSNLHEIIPISFNMGKILKQNFQNYTKDTFWYKLDPRVRQRIQKYLMCTVVHGLWEKQGKRQNP